jgi:outer membrane protein TolC
MNINTFIHKTGLVFLKIFYFGFVFVFNYRFQQRNYLYIIPFKLAAGLIVLFLFLVGDAEAGKLDTRKYIELDLEKAINLALKNNHDIQNSKLAIVKFQQDKKIFNTNSYPQLEILSFVAPIFDSRGDTNSVKYDYYKWGPLISFNATLIYPLYTFGAMPDGLKAYDYGIETTLADKNIVVNKTIFEVKKAYYQNLLVYKLENFSKEVEENLEKILEKANELYQKEDSIIKNKDIIQLELFEIEFKKIKNKIRTNKTLALKNISFLTGIDKDKVVSIKDLNFPKGIIKLPPLKNFFELALKWKPEYKKIKAGIKALEYKKHAQEALYYPQIFLAGKLNINYSTVGEKNDNVYFYNPYDKLSWKRQAKMFLCVRVPTGRLEYGLGLNRQVLNWVILMQKIFLRPMLHIFNLKEIFTRRNIIIKLNLPNWSDR